MSALGDTEYCSIFKEHNYSVKSEVYDCSAISREHNYSTEYCVCENEETMCGNTEIKIENIEISESSSYQTINTEDFSTDFVEQSIGMVIFDQVEHDDDSAKIKSESVCEKDETMCGNSEIKIEDTKVLETFSYQLIKTVGFCRSPTEDKGLADGSSDMVICDGLKNDDNNENLKLKMNEMVDTECCSVFKELNYSVVSEVYDSSAFSRNHDNTTKYCVCRNEETFCGNTEIKTENIEISESSSYQTKNTEDFCKPPSKDTDFVEPSIGMVILDQVCHDDDKANIKSESICQKDETMCENSEIKIEDTEVLETFSYQMMKTEGFNRTPTEATGLADRSCDMVICDGLKNDGNSENVKLESMEIDLEENSTFNEENILLMPRKNERDVESVCCKMENLAEHAEMIHSNFEEHKCHLCVYSTNCKSDLKKHINSIHSKLKKFKCNLCGYAANRTTDLKNHVDYNHLNIRNYECHLCDYAGNQKNTLRSHIKTVHFNLKNLKCQLCDYASNKITDLRDHIDSVHLKLYSFKCDHCDYASNRKGRLRSHVNSVHLNLRKYKCHLCNYAANQSRSLECHVNSVHLKLNKLKCDLCDYAANRKDYLKKHMNSVHLKLRKVECNLCDYATDRNTYLKKHLNTVHLNKI